ncbi:glycosyltransferase [Vibrio chagasii]|nr:glycosyltransferase [Vibrio chagasii]
MLKQTHKDIELIIIDDNSNDGTSISFRADSRSPDQYYQPWE